MAINYKFKAENDLLIVEASGEGDQLEEIFEYSEAIIAEALKRNSKKVFCDERNLSHKLGVLDTVKLAEMIRKAAPRIVRIALLTDEKEFAQPADFYEKVASNRGLIIFVTSDYDKAMKWLE